MPIFIVFVWSAVWENIIYLFCNTAFLSLFTMTFILYILYDKIHSKLEQKKPTKHIVNFRYILEVSDIYTTKYTLKLEQKSLQNIP